MKNFFLTAAAISAAIFISCTRESASVHSGSEVNISLDYSGSGPGTRSSLGDEGIESRVSNVLVLLYRHSDGKLDKTYFLKSASSSFSVLSSMSYDIFFLANIESPERIEIPGDMAQIGNLEYRIDSFERVAELGIPSCCSVRDVRFNSDGKLSLSLGRLFARINLRIIGAGISGGESGVFSNRTLKVHQSNLRLLPFASGGSRALSDSDVSDDADYEPLMKDTGDDSFVLYIPENRQGTLLAGNRDPSLKNADFLRASGKNPSVLTYLQFEARLNPAAAGYGGNLVYRIYPGADNSSNFDIERNGVYDMTLNFSTEDLFNPYWKVSHGEDWSDGRIIELLSERGDVLEDGAVLGVRPGYPAKFSLYMAASGSSANRFSRQGCSPYSSDGPSAAANIMRWTSNIVSSDEGTLTLPGTLASEGLALSLSDDGQFCISVKDASRLRSGKEYDIEVMLVPAGENHKKSLKIKVLPELKMKWEGDPDRFFLAQKRSFQLGGFAGKNITVEGPGGVLELERKAPGNGYDLSLDIAAVASGKTSLKIRSDRPLLDPEVELDLDILLPHPKLSEGGSGVLGKSLRLSFDGTAEPVGYGYYESSSASAAILPHSSFDPQLYESLLRPVVSHRRRGGPSAPDSFICADAARDSIFISRLSSAGERLWDFRKNGGSWDEVTLKPAGYAKFSGVDFPVISVGCLDPFPDHDGKVQDLGEFHIDATPSAESALDPFEFSSSLRINAARGNISIAYDGGIVPEVSFVNSGGNLYDMTCRFDFCSAPLRKGCDAGIRTLSVDVRNFRSGEKVSCLYRMTNYVKAMMCAVLDVYWSLEPQRDPESSINFSLVRMIWYDSWKRLKAMGPEDRLWTEEADYGVAGCVYDYACFYRETTDDYTEGKSWGYMSEIYSWVSSRLDHNTKRRLEWNWDYECLKFFRRNEFPLTMKEYDNPYLTIVTPPLDSEFHGWLGAYVKNFPEGYDYYDIE